MKKTLIMTLIFFAVPFIAQLTEAREIGDVNVTAFYRNQTYIRLHNPDDLMQCRNEFNLDLSYDKIPHLGFFIQLRPFYDLTYDWSSQGTGGNARFLRSGWAHNLGRNNDRDPLVREAFVDVTKDNLDLRAGRQIVSWGKSDGVYMLDLINPFNYRNLAEFNEEDVKIPQWMLNVNYSVGHGMMQFIWIPKFYPAVYPGHRIGEKGHDWEFNLIGLGNEVVNTLDDIFKNDLGIPEGFIVDRKEPATTLDNGVFGLRWSGFAKGFSYTLNYLYTWTPTWNDWPNTGDAATATALKRRLDRLSVFGFSIDRYFETGSFVLRLETAYTKGQPFALPDTNLKERDQIGYMLGLDRWVFTDWLVSFQVWQNYILDADKSKNPYIWLGANKFDWDTGQVTNGKIDPINSQFTAYVAHDGFFPGDTGHLEVFLLYNAMESYWWSWNKFRYDLSDRIGLAVGCNFYWGPNDSTLGQFRNHDNVFFEFRYSWN